MKFFEKKRNGKRKKKLCVPARRDFLFPPGPYAGARGCVALLGRADFVLPKEKSMLGKEFCPFSRKI